MFPSITRPTRAQCASVAGGRLRRGARLVLSGECSLKRCVVSQILYSIAGQIHTRTLCSAAGVNGACHTVVQEAEVCEIDIPVTIVIGWAGVNALTVHTTVGRAGVLIITGDG